MINLNEKDIFYLIFYFVLFIISLTLNIYIYIKTKKCVKKSDKSRIQTLVRQAGRYSVAALQDENTAIAILHSNYGAAYTYALFDIYTEEEISQAVDINIQEFKTEVQNAQTSITRKLYGSCPDIIPYAAKNLVSASQHLL